jgi:hypothetical protein
LPVNLSILGETKWALGRIRILHCGKDSEKHLAPSLVWSWVVECKRYQTNGRREHEISCTETTKVSKAARFVIEISNHYVLLFQECPLMAVIEED